MDIEFQQLRLKDFKSYEGKHAIPLSERAGVFSMHGDNQHVPKLGSNGAGKSTLLDALWFVLFGKTVRGLRAGNVRSWGKNKGSSKVGLELTLDGEAFTLWRQWNPNKLWYEQDDGSHQLSQEQLQDWLWITPEEARHWLVLGQHERMFFDMPNAEKQQLFNNVLFLDEWNGLSDTAKTQRDEIAQQLNTLDSEIQAAEAAAETLREQAQTQLDQADQHEEQRQQRIDAIREEINKHKKVRKNISTRKSKVNKQFKQLPDTSKLQETIDEYESRIDELREEERDHEIAQRDAGRDLDRLHKQVEHMNSLTGTCSNCGQKVTKAHRDREINKLNKEIESLESRLAEAEEAAETVTAEREEIEQSRASVQEELVSANKQRAELENQLLAVEQEETTAKHAIDEYEAKIAELDAEDNPLDDLAKQTLAKVESKEREARRAHDRYEKLEPKHAEYDFWVKGFKDIRLSVVNTALDQLEVEANNYLARFGLSDWYIYFDTERETKAGTVSKGFTVSIESPEVDGPVPWEAWSGGETQRLKLAGTLGLMSLLLNRRAVRSNLLILDEPTQFLGGTGVPDLIDLLADVAEDENKTVWFIDHRSEDYGGFAGTYYVTKDDSGSRVELEVGDV